MFVDKAFEIIEDNQEEDEYIGEIDEATIIDTENKFKG